MSGPLIGVVVPVYNRRDLAPFAIDSLIHQLGAASARVRIAVVDDGSTDGTFDVLQRRYRRHLLRIEDRIAGHTTPGCADGTILLIRQANQHVSAARNAGLRALYQLGCALFSHQDSDDLALPWKLDLLHARLCASAGGGTLGAGLVHAKCHDIGPQGFLLPAGRGDHEHHFTVARPGGSYWERARRDGFARGDLASINYIHNQTVMYTRAALESVGLETLYRTDLRYGEDWDLHQRMERAGVRIVFCDEPVALSRLSSGGLSERTLDVKKDHGTAPVSAEQLALVRDLSARRDRLLAAGQAVDAYQLAGQIDEMAPSQDNSAALERARQLLLDSLRPARDQALVQGNLHAALFCAKQIFALHPGAADAEALFRIRAAGAAAAIR